MAWGGCFEFSFQVEIVQTQDKNIIPNIRGYSNLKTTTRLGQDKEYKRGAAQKTVRFDSLKPHQPSLGAFHFLQTIECR
jgi:SET domain-containing protein